MLVLLTDFGASRTKAAIGDTAAGKILASRDYPSGTPVFSQNRHCEVSLEEIRNTLKKILDDFTDFAFNAVFISSEMHGFVVADKDGRPLTPYISWKDERCLTPYENSDYFSVLNEKTGDAFRTVSGMTARPCFPFYNAFAFLRETPLNEPVRILTLADWLAACFDQCFDKTHITMAAGLGFFNVRKKEYEQIFVDTCGKNISFNAVSETVVPAAVYRKNGCDIPVYTGVGDHQCAVFGADNDETTVSFNLGTGSQISVVSEQTRTQTDLRPFFAEKYLHTITHIPSGRALAVYAGFLGKQAFDEIDCLSARELEESSLDFDLAVFESAANFKGYQGIGNIREKNLTRRNWLASLIRSYADQYISLLKRFEIGPQVKTVVLSGGISRRIPALREYFEQHLPYKVVVADLAEETFFGLLKLATAIEEGKTV